MKKQSAPLLSRRTFLGGSLSAFGGLVLPADAFSDERPNLRFGVISDIHISRAWNQEKYLEKALRWFDEQGVDAVMVPGDIAHSGLIAELASFAAVWDRVFPNGRGRDGRPVERLFVTGNHDLDAHWTKGTDDWREKNVIAHGDNERKVWARLFHEDYQLIWQKRVKGYAFIGSQWPRKGAKPPVEEWFRENGRTLGSDKPFFYVQHVHPKGTCCEGKVSQDDGTLTRVLAPFPNAVVLTGHSHQTLADDSSVWQGAFTSVNAGCLRAGANDRWNVYDSDYPFWHPKRTTNRMKPLPVEEGRCGLLVDVFDGRLVIRRRAFEYDTLLGSDWCVTIPAATGGTCDPARQKLADRPPEFAPGAKFEAVKCPTAPKEIAGPALAGKPCAWLKIPHPFRRADGRRVYDFVLELRADGKPAWTRLLLANGFNVPEERSRRVTNCLIGAAEVPPAEKITLAVTPRTSFGTCGRSLLLAVSRSDLV